MELDKKLEDFKNALEKLNDAYLKAMEHKNSEDYPFFRDSTIQRFEFTLEIAWKSIKSFLIKQDGIECRSPKSCIREFFTVGYLSEDDTFKFLEMVDDRNLATHTYHESLAEDIFGRIANYIPLLKKTLHIILYK